MSHTFGEPDMRNTPPPDFNLSQFFDGIYTFQQWEIFPGLKTKGKDVAQTMQGLKVPEDLSNLRILDIAPWNGFFSFECVRRGAAEVISLGPDDPDKTGFNKVKDLLEISNCRYVNGSVYNLFSGDLGTFDIVLFLGIIYHLRHPLLALDRIFEVARKDLYVNLPIIDRVIFDKTISDEARQKIITECAIVHQLPMVYFTKGGETGDPYNWFMPNRRAFHDLVESSGFQIVHTGDNGGGWAWLSAVKGERPFVVDIEGYNPDTVNYRPNN